MARTSVYISDVIVCQHDNWQRQLAQLSCWSYLIHDVSLVLTSKLSWLLITVRLLATIPNKKSKLLQLEQQCPLYHQACKSFGAKFLPGIRERKKEMFISILHTYVMPSRLKIISQSTYQVNSKNNGLKPGPPRNIFYITNFTSKLLNCYVLKTLCSKAKQSRSLHCCIKCPQNIQEKTLLQTYTAFTCRIYNKILKS